MTILQKINSFILNLIEKDPIKTISSFSLVIGSIFLLMYFSKVSYFPTSISINDVFLISLLSFLVGIFFIFLVILILSYPVIIYQSCKKLEQFEKIVKYKYIQNYKKKKRKSNFFYKLANNCIKPLPIEKRYIPQTRLLFNPILFFILFSILIIYLVYSDEKYLDGYFAILLSFVFILFITSYTFTKYYKLIFSKLAFLDIFKSTTLYIYISRILISIFFILFSFIITYSIMLNSEVLRNNKFLLISYVVVCMLIFILINIIERNFKKRILINLFIFIGFLLITQTIHVIPYFILKSFNLAQVNINQIVIDKKACQILTPNSNKDYCVIEDVKLVWKVGNMYVFDKSLDKDYKSYKRYEIPKSSIISIEEIFIDEKKEEKVESK